MTRDASQAARETNGWPRGVRATLVLGVLLSVGVTALVCFAQRAGRERAFEAVGQGLQASLQHRLREPGAVLESLRALWLSSDLVERDEFHKFAKHLRSDGTVVRALDWIAWVPGGDDRAKFEGLASEELARPVRITAPDGRPAPPSDEHWVITYCESATGLDQDVGVDLRLSPEDAEALERSLATNALAIRIEPDAQGETLLVAALPLYADEHASEPDPPRRALRGFAVGRFALQPLFASAFEHIPKNTARGTVLPHTLGGPTLAEVGIERDRAAEITAGNLHYDFTLSIGGARLEVVSGPTDRWRAEHSSQLPWVLFASGVLVTAMLAWYLRSLDERRSALSRVNAELYTEIAERHSIELELRETQRKLETLVSNLPGLAYRCRNDADWTMEFISDGAIPLTGFKPNDFYSGRVSFGQRVIHEGDRERVWAQVQHALDAHQSFQLEYRIVTAFGDPKWVWEQGRGVYSRAGELLAIEGFIADMSERRSAQELLEREQSFIKVILRSVPGNFYVFDEHGHFKKWNDNVERVTGYSPLELARMHPLDFFPPVDKAVIARAVAEVFEQGSTRVNAELLTKDGRRLPYFFTGERFVWENSRFLVGVGIDDGERKKANEERSRLLASLLPTQKLENLGVLTGAVAHDFNNLLTVVLGNAGLAKKSLTAGSPAYGFLEQVIGASRTASHLTRQLLDYADFEGRGKREQVDSGKRQLELSKEIGAFAALLRSSIPRTITLELALAENLPPIEADPEQVQQLVMNLLLNAAESYGDGSGCVTLSIEAIDVATEARRGLTTLGERRPGPCVRLSVRDHGIGLDAATLARLGELFFTTKFAGRGLGLAAVLGILREHGGWLTVETQPGAGADFSAYFPVAS